MTLLQTALALLKPSPSPDAALADLRAAQARFTDAKARFEHVQNCRSNSYSSVPWTPAADEAERTIVTARIALASAEEAFDAVDPERTRIVELVRDGLALAADALERIDASLPPKPNRSTEIHEAVAIRRERNEAERVVAPERERLSRELFDVLETARVAREVLSANRRRDGLPYPRHLIDRDLWGPLYRAASGGGVTAEQCRDALASLEAAPEESAHVYADRLRLRELAKAAEAYEAKQKSDAERAAEARTSYARSISLIKGWGK